MSRTDKPKFIGSFKGQVCKQSIIVSKSVKFQDKFGEWRYGKIPCKSTFNWIWNGEEWLTEARYNPGASTVEEWLKRGNKIKKF